MYESFWRWYWNAMITYTNKPDETRISILQQKRDKYRETVVKGVKVRARNKLA